MGKCLSKSEVKGADKNDDSIPKNFICPITKGIMNDPVILCDGKLYKIVYSRLLYTVSII